MHILYIFFSIGALTYTSFPIRGRVKYNHMIVPKAYGYKKSDTNDISEIISISDLSI